MALYFAKPNQHRKDRNRRSRTPSPKRKKQTPKRAHQPPIQITRTTYPRPYSETQTIHVIPARDKCSWCCRPAQCKKRNDAAIAVHGDLPVPQRRISPDQRRDGKCPPALDDMQLRRCRSLCLIQLVRSNATQRPSVDALG